MKTERAVLLISGVLLISAAVLGGQETGKPLRLEGELADAPPSAQSLKNPYEGQAEAALAGRKLFKRHCAECHGPDGHGKGKAPDLRSPGIQGASPGTLFWFLKNGNLRRGMPSWSRLPDQQRWQLVTYLKTLAPRK